MEITTEIIPREKCRVCKVYLPKDCINDICLKCSKNFLKIKNIVVNDRLEWDRYIKNWKVNDRLE